MFVNCECAIHFFPSALQWLRCRQLHKVMATVVGFFLFGWDGVPKRMAKKKQCQQPQETIKLARHNEESYDQQDSWISVFMCCCLNGIGIEGEPWTMAS